LLARIELRDSTENGIKQRNMENDRKGDTNYYGPVTVNGDVGGLGSGDPILKKEVVSPETKSAKTPEAIQADAKALKKWKRTALWWFLGSLLVTIVGVYVYINELESIMPKTDWKTLKEKYQIIISTILGLYWSGFVLKLFYDRYFDASKAKSKIDLLNMK
jgi:hypothetical protein